MKPKQWARWYWRELWSWRTLFDMAVVLGVGMLGSKYGLSLWIQCPLIFALWLVTSIALLVFEYLKRGELR